MHSIYCIGCDSRIKVDRSPCVQPFTQAQQLRCRSTLPEDSISLQGTHLAILTVSHTSFHASKSWPDSLEMQLCVVSQIFRGKIQLHHSPCLEIQNGIMDYVFL